MKKQYLLLLIIPVCFIVFFVSLRFAEGPYYNGLADPSYVYLINSLSLAQLDGYGVGHVDHPGTPLQVAGAVVIRVLYSFTHEKPNLTEDVLYRPEIYLHAIDYTLIFLNSGALFLLGLIIYSIKKNIIIGLIFQTIPFLSMNIAEVFSLVKTENFIFAIALILIALMFKLANEENISPEKNTLYAVGTGVLCGLILATKISFISLTLLPLILIPGLSRKMIFLLTTFFSFIIFVLPAISNAEYFVSWVVKLIMHTDRYGQGTASILNLHSFFTNIYKISINEKFFVVVYSLSVTMLILLFFLRKDAKLFKGKQSGELKLLIAVFAAMSLQIILVAKHYSHRYMFPASILSIPALFIISQILYSKSLNKINANIYYATILSIIFLFSIYTCRKTYSRTRTYNSEERKVTAFLEANYADAYVIPSSGTSSQLFALVLGYYYSGEKAKKDYETYLNKRFQNNSWYDVWNSKIYSLSDGFDIKTIIKSGKQVIFQARTEKYNEDFIQCLKRNYLLENVKLSKVFSNEGGEHLFLITNNY